MAGQQNFRSAFNGFNREDVVHYIDYMNSRHAAEVNQLNEQVNDLFSQLEKKDSTQDPLTLEMLASAERERDSLKQELEALREQLAARDTKTQEEAEAQAQKIKALEQERDQAKEALAAVPGDLQQKVTELETRLSDSEAARKKAEEARDNALRQYNPAAQELEAYRRAERTERIARERAVELYRQANGVLADATAQVDAASARINEVADSVSLQLSQLQSAVSSSKQTLREAVATLYSIRPADSEEE